MLVERGLKVTLSQILFGDWLSRGVSLARGPAQPTAVANKAMEATDARIEEICDIASVSAYQEGSCQVKRDADGDCGPRSKRCVMVPPVIQSAADLPIFARFSAGWLWRPDRCSWFSAPR